TFFLQEARYLSKLITAAGEDLRVAFQRRFGPKDIEGQRAIIRDRMKGRKSPAALFHQHACGFRVVTDHGDQITGNGILFMKFSQQGEPAGDQPLAAKPVINAKLAKITDALLAAIQEHAPHRAAGTADNFAVASV